MEASGLVVLNHLIKVYSAGTEADPRGEDVLLIFKVLFILYHRSRWDCVLIASSVVLWLCCDGKSRLSRCFRRRPTSR